MDGEASPASLNGDGKVVSEDDNAAKGGDDMYSEIGELWTNNEGNDGASTQISPSMEMDNAAGMEGILEGIITQDGHMEIEMGDDQYLASLAEQIPDAASPDREGGRRKIVASKSTGKGKAKEDDRKPAAEKKRSVEEFQNGAPKKHKIKASKMVSLQKARDSVSPDDMIVLSDSEEEDPKGDDEFGIKDADDDDVVEVVLGDQQQKKADHSYDADDGGIKKLPPKNAQGNFTARDIEVGEKVYCEFSGNKRYYWGVVVERTKKKKSRFYKYHVRFDDGDEEFDMSSTKMVTVAEYIASFGEEKYHESISESDAGALPPVIPDKAPTPPPAAESPAGTGEPIARLTTADLLVKACGKCSNCKKPNCGACGICKAQKRDQCCYQKMCFRIPEQAKLQSYTALPEGMGFCFKDRESNLQYEGLVLVSKGGRRYRSFESCFFKTKPDDKTIVNFYAFVGLKDRYKPGVSTDTSATSASKPMQKTKSKNSAKTLSPHELSLEKCGQCAKCTRPDCGRCVCCRGNKRNPNSDNCCYQKMCLEIDVTRKAQPCPATFGNFPPGWNFVFDVPRPEQPHLEGLLLLPPPPNALKYFSVEKAVRHMPKVLSQVDEEAFYSFVGLAQNVKDGMSAWQTQAADKAAAKPAAKPAQAKRPPNGAPAAPKAKKARVVPADIQTGLSLRELHEKRCKSCYMCIKPTCKQCSGCRANEGQTRTFKDVCIQKMCCKIKVEDKAQIAKGFPEGWRFYYTDPGQLSWQSSGEHTGLAGLVLLSPTGRQFNSVEATEAVLGRGSEITTIARDFYGDVGCHAVVEVSDHVLLGKPFRQKWVDVEGKTKMVYGKVVKVSEDLLAGGTRTCTVEFSEKSRSLLNAGFALNGSNVPQTQQMPQTLAFGGCVDCDPRAVRFDKLPYHLSWNVPDIRHEDFVVDEHGMFAPRLTMHFRGFHLIFTAKTSTIPNSGKGVFLSCSTLSGSEDDYFMLNAGELLDLGVYAPFRRSDKKTAHVFLMKNFIHSSQCEEWNFDTVLDDNLFDITDDTTGKLHEVASRHLPAYVNETDGMSTASVFAQHDPEGCVHYLLGHGNEEDGPFTLQANGEEREIFIDYGEQYEDVRVRKNYSRLSPEDAAERRLELDQDYKEVLDEMKTYNATEIIQCVNFMMQDVFYPNRPYPASVVIRALLVTVLFRNRAESYMEEFASLKTTLDEEEEEEAGSVCHNGFSRSRMELVIQKSKNLIKQLFQFCNSWQQIKETLLANEMYCTCLEIVLGEADYRNMSLEKLRELIVGRK